LRTRDVLQLSEDAQRAGVSAVLLPPVSYQPLTDDEVFSLYEEVTSNLSVPLCVDDSPGTTHFEFSDDLHGRIAHLPQVRTIKIPGVPDNPLDAKARVEKLRALIPKSVTIGVSGDWFASTELNAGCEAWYSVIGGPFPEPSLALTRVAQAGDAQKAIELSAQLEPLWDLFKQHGGLRTLATAADLLGLASGEVLARPLCRVGGEAESRREVILDDLNLR
jgi:4-hydroxy-tetrahydrodipicolinate synthase